MIEGKWELVAAVAFDPGETAAAEAGVSRDEFNHGWLAGDVLTEEPPLEPLTGLTLTIAADGSFTETGTAAVEWFDEEGVLESNAVPFNGTIETTPAGMFLLSEAGPATKGEFADLPDLRLRRDDGDTGVTDLLTVDGDHLTRVMSVITDGVYPNRVRLEYRRA